MLRILHVTDLHYELNAEGGHHFSVDPAAAADPAGAPFLSSAISDAVLAAGLRIDAMAITGDLTAVASEPQMRAAIDGIRALAGNLRLDLSKVLVIPGNHDVDWNLSRTDRFSEIRKAIAGITGRQLDPELLSVVAIESDGMKVDLIGANSAAIEDSRNAGMGMIGRGVLARISKLAKTAESNARIPVLCMHHHVLPVAYVEREYFQHKETNSKPRTSVTLDAKAILSTCAHAGIPLILHGHHHHPSLAVHQAINPADTHSVLTTPVWVSGAGSAGVVSSRTGSFKLRHFQVVELDSSTGIVTCTFRAFVQDADNENAFRPGRAYPVMLAGSDAKPDMGTSEIQRALLLAIGESDRIRINELHKSLPQLAPEAIAHQLEFLDARGLIAWKADMVRLTKIGLELLVTLHPPPAP